MLGIGIFIAPPVVADQLDRPGTFLLMWLVGGLSALCGALSVAELGAMMPEAGGDYPYLRRAYGAGLAYAAGWLQLLAIFPGSLAAMAVGTARFQLPVILGDAYAWPTLLGLPPAWLGAGWALLIVVGLTGLNHVGVVFSGRVQVALAGIPLGILTVASIAVFAERGMGEGAWAQAGPELFGNPGIHALALAFLPVYFAYSGWNAAIYIGGEIRDPARALPRALVWGTVSVTLVYMILLIGFLGVFSMDALANTGEAGTAAAQALFGRGGELAITTLICLAMLGSINGTVLTGSRIAFAMAQQGDCPAVAGRLHPRFGTPAAALWLQAAWTLVLVATQRFEQLVSYASAAMLITGTLTVLAVMVLRRREPDRPRPYRTWGYPWTPLFYAISSVGVLLLLAGRSLVTRSDGAGMDVSVALCLAWFGLALAFHRLVVAPRAETAALADSK